jgi:hypothetical protein
MALNILQSDEACHICVKSYAKKFDFKKGDKFELLCRGIPKQYVSDAASLVLSGSFDAQMVLDPVLWAAEVLDWHCLDPNGEVWARKNTEEYLRQMQDHPERQSKYHRPYQATMLRCSSKYKVFRLGRQSGKTETLVISMLFHMFTNAGFKIVLITPFQSQIDLIFKRLEDLIHSNSTLQNSIKRSVKAPNYTLILHNGSQLKGFTAGTKSNNGAASVRGQDANMLVFDEGDYLNKADLDAAMAIVTNYPEATVWMSSTPTGRREKFYDLCFDKEWKEFHYPSHVNPNWSEHLDKFFKKNLTSIGYKHEILGEFGEQEEGIFQASYVDRAMSDYTYGSMYPESSWLYSIGVDWNGQKIGTTIYVTGFNPSTNKFMTVESVVVQKEGWTQTAACQKIVELNRKWRPFAIYVDRGFGGTQIEVLHKYGFDARSDPQKGANHIDAKLARIVKPFDFGSSVEIRDPFTKELRNKPAKGFLVENSVRRFESGDILLPKEDVKIKKELLAYIVKNVSPTGMISYTTTDESIGDHNLDALMLSLVAFTLEKSIFGKLQLNEKIHFTTIDGKSPDMISEPSTIKEEVPARLEQRKEFAPPERNNFNKEKPLPNKLWSWPGFAHDKPRPTPGSGNNLFNRAKNPKRSSF